MFFVVFPGLRSFISNGHKTARSRLWRDIGACPERGEGGEQPRLGNVTHAWDKAAGALNLIPPRRDWNL